MPMAKFKGTPDPVLEAERVAAWAVHSENYEALQQRIQELLPGPLFGDPEFRRLNRIGADAWRTYCLAAHAARLSAEANQ